MQRRVNWIHSVEDFNALAPEWDALAAGGDPFSDWSWFDAWWRAFGAGRRLEVCTLREGDQLLGAYALCRSGAGLRGLANSQTPAFRPVARDALALAQISDAVRRAAPQLELPVLPGDEPAHRAMHDCVRAAGGLDFAVVQKRSPITDTRGSFEEYRKPRKGQWREMERRSRKAARDHHASFSLIEPATDFEALLEEGLVLEAAGWKGRAGTAILSSSPTADFFRDVARAAARRGELRFSTLRLDGVLAAFDLALVTRGRYFLLKTAYDESARSLAPGLVLRRAVIEECFSAHLDAHEFLGIDMAWKRLFATEYRDHVRYRAYRTTRANRLRHGYRARVRPRAKRWLEAWRARNAPADASPAQL